MNCTSGDMIAPAPPPKADPMAKARSVMRRVSTPRLSARTGFSRSPLNARPQGELTIQKKIAAETRKRIRTKGSVANFAECRHSLICGQNYATSSAKVWNAVAPLVAI